MRKFLRVLLIILLLLVVVVVIAGLIAPKETNITATTTINAPKEAVWEQMVKFRNWPNWSAWHKMDTNSVLTYTGTDGEPGSTYSWKSDKTGEGTMTNKSVENGKMTYELKFVKPFEAVSDGYLMVEDAGNGATKATWTFHGTNDNFMMRSIGYLMGMRKSLQKQFDEGLANMKAHVESHKSDIPATASAPTAYTIQETQFPARIYAGARRKVKEQDYQNVFNEIMGKVQAAAGDRISGPSVSIIYHWDTATHVADMFAGFPIKDDKPVAGATIVKVPASRAYLVAYTGDPAKTAAAHEAISAHMAPKNEKETLVIEEYITAEEKDLSKWVTNIYYLVK